MTYGELDLRDYLCGLVAAACGIDAEHVTGSPLPALGAGTRAMLTIQHSIEADLGVHVTIPDLCRAPNVAALTAWLADRLGRSAGDPGGVRLYCWVSGARVPAHAALRLAERPRRASLRPVGRQSSRARVRRARQFPYFFFYCLDNARL
jgi:hypothetical protein